MTERVRASTTRVSRRTLFRGIIQVTGGAALVATGVALAGSAEAATKASQSAAGYQSKPKGKAQCDGCSLWQAPAACKLVAGVISPSGWCNLYSPKS